MFQWNRSRRSIRSTARAAARRHPVFVEAIENRRYCDGDNSFGTAANLGTVSTIVTHNGSLTSGSDTKDYYKFTVPSGVTTFKAMLSGTTSNADLYLYNSSQSQIGSSTLGGTGVELISKQPLSAGTYYVQVKLVGSTTNYKLDLMSDTAGSATGTARSLGELTSSQKTINEYTGTLDSNDYYKFTTTGSFAIVNIALQGLTANLDVQLLNSGGSVIQQSSKTGTTSESAIFGVNAGTYYVRVYPSGMASNNYTLKLSKTSLPADPAGESTGTAQTLSLDSIGNATTSGTIVNSTDTTDYYKITVDEPGLIYASLNGLNDDLDVAILNSSGTQLAISSPSGFLPNFTAFETPTGGTFYIKVLGHSASSASTYNLSVTAPKDKAGNSTGTATMVWPTYTASNAHVGGTIDTADFFKFTSPDFTYITMDLTDTDVASRVRFYGSAGDLEFTQNTDASGNASLTIFVHTGGTFYCSVSTQSSATWTNYDLSIKLQAF